jgi:hypothetical protein
MRRDFATDAVLILGDGYVLADADYQSPLGSVIVVGER